MRVLFASGIDGFCHRYAVLHWAEQLATQGIASTVRAHGDPRLATELASHDVVVLYRVPFSPWVVHLLARARALDRATVFAIDDLIFCPEVEDVPALRRLDDDERRLWREGVERYRRTLLACDALLATSAPLAEAGRAAGKPAYLHRAGLAARELALGAAARALADADTAASSERPVRLGYFSGTTSHQDDFAAIVEPLAEVLESNREIELVIGGHLALDPRLARLGGRAAKIPFVPWTELPRRIAGVDVNLAPLEWRHPFAAAKGAIKYLEAAAVGVATVASPGEAYRDAIRHGTNGLLASDAGQWRAALSALAQDRALRVRLGAAARADVEARFGPEVQGRALAALLADVLTRRGSRPAAAVAEPVDELVLARVFGGEVARAAREPQARPGYATRDCSAVTPPLGDGVLLAQPMRASENGLSRIDLHTVTYGQTLDHLIEIGLRRDDGTMAATGSLAAALAPDRDWFAFEFPPEPHSAGRRYTLEIRARGTGACNALSFGASADPEPEGPFTLAGVAATGSLTLRSFAVESAQPSAVRRAC